MVAWVNKTKPLEKVCSKFGFSNYQLRITKYMIDHRSAIINNIFKGFHYVIKIMLKLIYYAHNLASLCF